MKRHRFPWAVASALVAVLWMAASSCAAGENNRYPPLPKGMTSLGGAVIGDWLYIYGGHYGRAHHYSNTSQSKELRRLNLRKPEKWEVVATGPGLQGLAMVAHGGKLVRIGGFTAHNKEGEKHDLRSVADVVSFDPKTKKWTKLPSLPEPRSSHDAVVIGDDLYVAGGWQLGKGRKWHVTAWMMDLSEKKLRWRPLPNPPFQRRALALGELGGKLFAIGGMQRTGGPTTRVDVYDPKTSQWSKAKSLIGKGMEGFGSSAFLAGGRLYVSTYKGNLQRLDREGAEWRIATKLKQDRFFHRMVPWRNQLILVGGASMRTGKCRSIETFTIPSR